MNKWKQGWQLLLQRKHWGPTEVLDNTMEGCALVPEALLASSCTDISTTYYVYYVRSTLAARYTTLPCAGHAVVRAAAASAP
jgi:hypothetical protein